ncbi:hypothetical protein COX69_04385 [Candidatus Falkowbacteria bacterium CG_4_10_14_0_2_um_filter_48_10]|nr:MAG: hypothetical protein COX69_04385 [Candidatus Falkowbacteria bacterium CG_4_10_14_0_2_um_filter_48_10]
MFSKLKHFKELRDQAKNIRQVLGKESVKTENKGVTLTMDGNMEVSEVVIDPELNPEQIAQAVKNCVNEAIKKTQRIMAEKIQSLGGLKNL